MYRTREEWLNAVAEEMCDWFTSRGFAFPRLRMAIGFPSTGKRGKRIGECWDQSCSGDGVYEVLIRPDLEDPVTVAATLAHEIVHAVIGLEHQHKGPFRKLAVAIGLTGKMTATVPGPLFLEAVAPILASVGRLPHARLGFGNSTGPKKQTARLIKVECLECGYTVRVARKWLTEVGAPHCPEHGAMHWDDDGEIPEVPEDQQEAGF